MADQKFHPALAVTNIRNSIPITLQIEKAQYSSWAELFRIHCEATLVLDHIQPPADSTPTADPQWKRLDAIVLQWLYGTIDEDLRETVIKAGASAYEIWTRLENIFYDNKNQRALYLEHKFSNLKQDEFPTMSSYCQELKSLADQLGNVGSKVSNQRLVLQMISGLNDSYDGLAQMISQTNPLPPFYEARSRLVMEETRKAQKSGSSDSALHSSTHHSSGGSSSRHSGPKKGNSGSGNYGNTFTNTGNGQSAGRNNKQTGKPRGNVGGSSAPQQQQSQQFVSGMRPPGNPMQRPFNPWAFGPSPWAWMQWPYTAPPPCPYPTAGWARPVSSQQGVLGPRPQQAFAAQDIQQQQVQATDIDAAMHTLTMPVPDDNWIFDTGATSHMTSNDGYTDGNDNYEMY